MKDEDDEWIDWRRWVEEWMMMNVAVVCDSCFVDSNHQWILDVTIVMDDTASREVYYARATGREAELRIF